MTPNKKKRRVVRLTASVDTPLDAISLVDMPAIEENFRLFGVEQLYVFARMNQEKRIVTGPAMIPDKMIPRVDQKTGEIYDVYFSPEDVELTSQMFMQFQKQNAVNIQHDEFAQGVTVVESWIVDGQNDKSVSLGYDVAPGTWMVSMKVDDPAVWEMVKSGVVRGFSIEGYFAQRAIEAAKIKETIMEEHKFAAITLADGTVVYSASEAPAAGDAVFSDEAMTLPVADGSYTLTDGTVITVTAGVVGEAPVETPEDETPAEDAPEAPATEETPADVPTDVPAEIPTDVPTEDAPAEATPTDGPSGDQVLAMISDLMSRVQGLEELATKSAEAVNNAETKLSVAMAKIEELSKAPGGKSITEKFSDNESTPKSGLAHIREMARKHNL